MIENPLRHFNNRRFGNRYVRFSDGRSDYPGWVESAALMKPQDLFICPEHELLVYFPGGWIELFLASSDRRMRYPEMYEKGPFISHNYRNPFMFSGGVRAQSGKTEGNDRKIRTRGNIRRHYAIAGFRTAGSRQNGASRIDHGWAFPAPGLGGQ
jgi:hypothetical protein